MLHIFGFESVAVVASDLFFEDPSPEPGNEGAERGVRIEVRRIRAGELRGSIYSAMPISVDEPIWRGDLFELADGAYGTFDRTHHHPHFNGWEPSRRRFVPELTASPVEWVAKRLSDLPTLLAEARVELDSIAPGDVDALHQAVPQIVDAVRGLLAGIHAGELARTPDVAGTVRSGWL